MPLSNPFIKAALSAAERNSPNSLHRLVQVAPFEVSGMGVNEVLVGAAIRLIEAGNKEGLEIAQQLLTQTAELETRSILHLRKLVRERSKEGRK